MAINNIKNKKERKKINDDMVLMWLNRSEAIINTKNNTNNKTHFEFIPFGLGLLIFFSHLLHFCLQAPESLPISCTHLIGFW